MILGSHLGRSGSSKGEPYSTGLLPFGQVCGQSGFPDEMQLEAVGYRMLDRTLSA